MAPHSSLLVNVLASGGEIDTSAHINAPTSKHKRDGNDKQNACCERQNLDGVIVWSVTV